MYIVCFLCRCVVPPITVSTPILDYGRCFLHHPYELPVHLFNESDLPAKYELLSQVKYLDRALCLATFFYQLFSWLTFPTFFLKEKNKTKSSIYIKC